MTECVDSTTKGAEKNANAAVEESSLINTTPNADSGMPQATADSGISVSGPGRQIEMITVDQLAPYAGNARTHTKKQIRQLAKSIERFGFTNPILMDDHGQVIAGHGRLEAAKLLGMNAVPTLRLSHLSEADKRAYLIADNRLAEQARWDRELLAIELQALVDLDFDVEVTGFQMGEIEVAARFHRRVLALYRAKRLSEQLAYRSHL
jgi:ParB-like chromosome segregation protein Spo0J